ncbi:ABC transporter ATP-binding protein [Actinomadura sp. NPDC047616]|uniref:ABC transporter ATP-binding protein n=1 Tax=Actinomadura sp. NPDC047616 TaxID=3155914 RepID=UPI0033F0C4A0
MVAGPDPLFGPGLRIAHEKDRDTAGGGLAALWRLPVLVGMTARLGWRADRWGLLAVAAGQLASAAATTVTYLTTQRLLTGMFSAGPAGRKVEMLTSVLVVMVVAMMVRGLSGALTTGASGRLGPRISRSAHTALLERAAEVELARMEDPAFHNLLLAAQRGADATRRVTERVVGLSGGLMAIVAAVAVLATMDALLVPLLLLTLVPQAWGMARTVGARHASITRWMELTRQLDQLSMLLTHRESAEEVRVHRMGRFLLHHYRRLAMHSEQEQARLARREACIKMIAGAVSGAAGAYAYGLLAFLVATGRMSFAVAGTAAFAIRSSSMSLTSLVMQTQTIHEDAMYIADWRRACTRADESAIPSPGARLPGDPEVISTHRLCFTYPGARRPALDGVDVRVRRGEVVAFVGENGSGKSTLAKLLAGLYVPSEGAVLWDGVPTNLVDRRDLFDRISLVSQDFVQWPFTARMNVAVGRADRPLDERLLRRAAAAMGAEPVVARLDDGWDTLLAREFWGGTNLSGGQWQRLGLARAWYRDAPVLVVDEPTSALDPTAEIEIFDRIMELAGRGRTVILITHRLASVARADRIYVLDGGVVVEQGTHDRLLRSDGVYAAMYRAQAAQYEAAG